MNFKDDKFPKWAVIVRLKSGQISVTSYDTNEAAQSARASLLDQVKGPDTEISIKHLPDHSAEIINTIRRLCIDDDEKPLLVEEFAQTLNCLGWTSHFEFSKHKTKKGIKQLKEDLARLVTASKNLIKEIDQPVWMNYLNSPDDRPRYIDTPSLKVDVTRIREASMAAIKDNAKRSGEFNGHVARAFSKNLVLLCKIYRIEVPLPQDFMPKRGTGHSEFDRLSKMIFELFCLGGYSWDYIRNGIIAAEDIPITSELKADFSKGIFFPPSDFG